MMPSISAMPDRMVSRHLLRERARRRSPEDRRLVAILIPPSGLRISWATPAAISPSEASFSRWISRRCVSTCSVRSRSTPTVPRSCPPASKMRRDGQVGREDPAPRASGARTSPFHAWPPSNARRRPWPLARVPLPRSSAPGRPPPARPAMARRGAAPAGFMVTSRPSMSVVKMQSSTLWTTRGEQPLVSCRASSSVVRSDCCICWNDVDQAARPRPSRA